MAKQIVIIGLGQFGMSLARTLADKGHEVLAVDTKMSLVEQASMFVTEALVLDCTDEAKLARLDPAKRDISVVAIGSESKEASIIATALLRQMGAPVVVSRANDIIHQRILRLVGAHHVINPEYEFGQRFANKLLYREIVSDTNIGENLNMTEVAIPPAMLGKTLAELALPQEFGATVIGVRHTSTQELERPDPSVPFIEGDSIVVVTDEPSLLRMLDVFTK